MSDSNIELTEYIEKHKRLFRYYLKDNVDIGPSLVVETILNDGNMEDIGELFQLMGIKNVAKTFFDDTTQGEREIDNYSELTLNYFTLLFKRYAC
jgi:hypothetical protein